MIMMWWQVKKVKKHRVADDTSSTDVRNHFQQFQNFKNMESDAVSSEISLNYVRTATS